MSGLVQVARVILKYLAQELESKEQTTQHRASQDFPELGG